jgi:hypothetical protein
MKRRNFLLGSASVFTAACTTDLHWLKSLKKQYPNVLMLIVDDLNSWTGATQGTTFTNAHAPAPLCGPSRASIMTGLAPTTTGIYGHIHDNKIGKR